MKKILSILILVLITFSVCACGNNENSGDGGKTITLNLNEPTEAGSLEYTIHEVKFAKSINYEIYDGYMGRSEGKKTSEDNVIAIVRYSIKNIGKESISNYYFPEPGYTEYIAVGRFVYGDGYTYEHGFYDGRRPYAYRYNESPESANYILKETLEPLTSLDNCITYLILPTHIVEDTSEKLFYVISLANIGDNITLRYEITDRTITE